MTTRRWWYSIESIPEYKTHVIRIMRILKVSNIKIQQMSSYVFILHMIWCSLYTLWTAVWCCPKPSRALLFCRIRPGPGGPILEIPCMFFKGSHLVIGALHQFVLDFFLQPYSSWPTKREKQAHTQSAGSYTRGKTCFAVQPTHIATICHCSPWCKHPSLHHLVWLWLFTCCTCGFSMVSSEGVTVSKRWHQQGAATFLQPHPKTTEKNIENLGKQGKYMKIHENTMKQKNNKSTNKNKKPGRVYLSWLVAGRRTSL